jgi:hypothetical protein
MNIDTKLKIAHALRLIAEALENDSQERGEWVNQHTSPLGRGRHCAAVKRRVASGDPGACMVGRKHSLSPEALAEELASVSRRTLTKKVAPQSSSVIDELKRELRMIGK